MSEFCLSVLYKVSLLGPLVFAVAHVHNCETSPQTVFSTAPLLRGSSSSVGRSSLARQTHGKT